MAKYGSDSFVYAILLLPLLAVIFGIYLYISEVQRDYKHYEKPGEIYMGRGDYKDALPLLQKYCELHDDIIHAHIDLATCYVGLKNMKEARREYSNAIIVASGKKHDYSELMAECQLKIDLIDKQEKQQK